MSGFEVLLLAFVISLVAGGVNGVWQFRVKRALKTPGDPRRILDARFAKGEIDEAEYGRRLSVLQVGPPMDIFDLPPMPAIKPHEAG